MARYLAIPRYDPVLGTLSMVEVALTPEARGAQVSRVIEARRQTRGGGLPRRMLRSAKVVAHPEDTLPVTGAMVLELDDPSEVASLRASLPDYEVHEDLPLSLIRPVKASEGVTEGPPDTWHLDAIALAAARATGFVGAGEGVGVAVLDTGVAEVEEIAGRVVSSFRLDPETQQPVACPTEDTEGHGTHVAGLVAGRTVGVAPGADLMNYIMLPGALGYISDFIYAIDFVAQRPEIAILNMSAGIPGYNGAMKQAIGMVRRMGVLPVVAIGNEGANLTRSPGNYADVLSVGAATREATVASFSGGGAMVADAQSYDVPDLVGPGKGVTSCVMGGGYEAWNGSSMATPIVSGVAALILERHPTMALSDLVEAVMSVLKPLADVPPARQGGGMVQLPPELWQLVG
ncbi:S8 family peptidase [Sagittula sp. S175]|uniref:S8 family peptidase n=1 Tax=Sagittula sp. S175 TaxID=3415129 RepID=UPI003C7BBB1C